MQSYQRILADTWRDLRRERRLIRPSAPRSYRAPYDRWIGEVEASIATNARMICAAYGISAHYLHSYRRPEMVTVAESPYRGAR